MPHPGSEAYFDPETSSLHWQIKKMRVYIVKMVWDILMSHSVSNVGFLVCFPCFVSCLHILVACSVNHLNFPLGSPLWLPSWIPFGCPLDSLLAALFAALLAAILGSLGAPL